MNYTYEYKVPTSSVCSDEVSLEVSSARPNLMKIIGPTTRSAKSGDTLAIKLMFTNRREKIKDSQATSKIMLFIEEQDGFGEQDGADGIGSFGEDDDSLISHQVCFLLTYAPLSKC